MMRIKTKLFLIITFFCCALSAFAGTITWTGVTSTNWSEASNWSTSTVPTISDEVIIPQLSGSSPNYPVLTANVQSKSVSVQNGASLDLGIFFILDSINTLSKLIIEDRGSLFLNGFDSSGGGIYLQSNWFSTTINSNSTSNEDNKINLKTGSNVIYNDMSSDNDAISKGPYYNLTFAKERTIEETHNGFTVLNDFTCNKNITITIENYTVSGSEPTIKVKNIKINSGVSLTTGRDIEISGDFTNNGTFNVKDGIELNFTSNSDHTISSLASSSFSSFYNLNMKNATNRKLNINGSIIVRGDLTLSGTSPTSILELNGLTGAIYLDLSQTDKGQYLKINTDNVKIRDGSGSITYTVKDSVDHNGDTIDNNGWKFLTLPTQLKWNGTEDNKWDNKNNWTDISVSPSIAASSAPAEITEVTIPAGCSNYPVLTANVQAKSVVVQSNGKLNIANYSILNGAVLSTVTVEELGELILDGNSDQARWFHNKLIIDGINVPQAQKINLKIGSKIIYAGVENNPSEIFPGPYFSVEFQSKRDIKTPTNSSSPPDLLDLKVIHELKCAADISFSNVEIDTHIFVVDNGKTVTANKLIIISKNNLSTEPNNYFVNKGSFKSSDILAFTSAPGTNCYINTTNTSNTKIATLEVDTNASLDLGTSNITITDSINNSGLINSTPTGSTYSTVTLNPPAGGTTTITGTDTAGNTVLGNLIMESAGGKTLTINKKITVNGELKLSGTGTGTTVTNRLTVDGANGEIYLNENKVGGKYLKINTTNVQIKGATVPPPKTYSIDNSVNQNNKTPYTGITGENGWLFVDAILPAVSWTGTTDTDWNTDTNWNPQYKPTKDTAVTIPALTGGTIKYPILTASVSAKSVEIAGNAELDLAGNLIKIGTDPTSLTAKLTNSGTLRMTGTAEQKAWFENGTTENKMSLSGTASTVEYNSNSNAVIWNGGTTGYHNLIISDTKNISSTDSGGTGSEIKVSELTTINGTIILNSQLNSKDLIVASGTLTAGANISLTGNFTNNGTFSSTGTVNLDPTVAGISITGTSTASNTSFKNLSMAGAGGKTLTINNKITVNGELKLSGTAGNLLNITGNGEIALKNSQKDKGQYLKVNTENVKIAGKDALDNPCTYLVRDSVDNLDGTTNNNGWLFFKEININGSIIKVDTKDLYIIFTQDLPNNEFNTSSLKIKSGTIEILSETPAYINPKTWKFTLASTAPIDMIADKNSKIILNHYGKEYTKNHISDIGIGIVNVLFATNTKTIRNFDGTKRLPQLNTIIATDIFDSADVNRVELYFSSYFDNGFWSPVSFIKNMIKKNDNIIKIPFNTTEGNIKKFTIKENNSYFKKNSIAEFMFVYDGWLPCARLQNSTDIFSFDVWKFFVAGVKYQRGDVSIFNNVIDPQKNEKVKIQINLKKSGRLTIQLMTLDGSIVKTITRVKQDAGIYLYEWDGRNSSGNSVARGIYFIRIAGPDIDETRKVMVIK